MWSRYLVPLVVAAALPAFSQTPPDLGFASSFAVLGGSNVTNSGATILAGNVGGRPVSGFSGAKFVLGEDRGNDALAQQGRRDADTVYKNLANQSCTATLLGDLGKGRTLMPGVYCVSSSAVLTGALTLDAAANPGAVWIFKIEGSLTTGPGSTVQTIEGGRDNNVFWRITGSATLGTKSVFAGNVLAAGNISVDRSATVSGRLLTPGAVSLTNAGVTICCALLDMTPHVLPSGVSGADYNQMLTPAGGKAPYRFALVGSDLPAGVTVTEGGALSVRQPAAGVYKLAVAISDADGFNCIRVYRLVICGPITLSPLPEPEACIPYDRQIMADPDGLTFIVTSGELPAGLELSTSGRLHGTPKKVQDYDFTVTVSDVFGCTGSRRYTGHISSILNVLPETDSLPEGAVGEEYRQELVVTGGSGTYTFTLSGDVPPGLAPPPGTYTSDLPALILSGRPTKGDCYKFTLTVATSTCEALTTHEYKLVIRPVPIFWTPADPVLPQATVCEAYCQEFSASACTGVYVVDAVLAGALPPGLTFDPTTRKLCGTPSAAGSYTFTLVARDDGHTASRDYSLVVRPHEVPIDRELPPATACIYYKHQLNPNGCDPSCTFTSLPEDLPSGLKLSESGLLHGTPTVPGDYTFNVTVTPKDCLPVTVELHLIVLCNVTISPPQLPNGRVGIFYSKTLSADCGTPPYTFTLVSGSLPPGLGLSPAGTISGIPAALGCFNFRVRATDSATPACSSEQTYQICIVLAAAQGMPVLSGWGMGALFALLIVAAFVTLRRHCV